MVLAVARLVVFGEFRHPGHFRVMGAQIQIVDSHSRTCRSNPDYHVRYRDLDSDKQLPLYLLESRDLYDGPVMRAGYAYVGPLGPRIDARNSTDTELDTVAADAASKMTDIEAGAYEDYETGAHCQWCRHNHLPYGQEWRDEQGIESESE